MKPKVSVVMPIFRKTKEKLTAIDSILNQTFKDLELIIIDGSADNKNFEMISSIKDERIRYFKVKGYINCLNYGIEQAKGIYIARMDDDDISLPTRIEEQVCFLDNNPEIALCSCLVEFFGERNDISSHKKEINLLNLIENQEFIHPAMMFRKSINIHFEKIKPSEDCLLFRKLLLDGYKFAIIDKVLFKNYVSKNSIMANYPKYCKFSMSRINVFALAKYYNYNLSFIDKIIFSKSFSHKEIIEFLKFSLFLKQKLKQTNLKFDNICLPFFSYMISKNKHKMFLFKERLFYQTFFPIYTKNFLKLCLQTIFSIKNEYYKFKKIKILRILGLKFKLN